MSGRLECFLTTYLLFRNEAQNRKESLGHKSQSTWCYLNFGEILFKYQEGWNYDAYPLSFQEDPGGKGDSFLLHLYKQKKITFPHLSSMECLVPRSTVCHKPAPYFSVSPAPTGPPNLVTYDSCVSCILTVEHLHVDSTVLGSYLLSSQLLCVNPLCHPPWPAEEGTTEFPALFHCPLQLAHFPECPNPILHCPQGGSGVSTTLD